MNDTWMRVMRHGSMRNGLYAMVQPPFPLPSASTGTDDSVSFPGSELEAKEWIEMREKNESMDILERVVM